MNSYERIMAVLSGRKPDRVPVIPWVRDWCIRLAGFGIVDMMENVGKYVYAQYEARKQFGYDTVFGISGAEEVSVAMGAKLYYDNQTPPRVEAPFIHDYDQDFADLRIPNPYQDGLLPMLLEVITRLKQICEGEIPVAAWLPGPLRHALTLRGYKEGLQDMYKNQDNLKDLLNIATDSLLVYAVAMADAGADIVIISDPPSSGKMISLEHCKKWSIPYMARLTAFLKRTGMKSILHVCGDIMDRLDVFSQFEIDALSVDETVDLGSARKILGDEFCIMGNVSPSGTLTRGTPEDVRNESRECIQKAGKNGAFILGSGCLCPGKVKSENIAAMIAAAVEYGQY